MESYCRYCYHPYHKTLSEYYKPIMSRGFPICIKCNTCVDCCHFICRCVRCQDCYEVIDVCHCDNDPMQYSNTENAFSSDHTNHQLNDIIYKFNNMQIRETPYIEEVIDDMDYMDDIMEMQ